MTDTIRSNQRRPDDDTERARRAFDAVHRDPLDAQRLANSVLEDKRSRPPARALAQWALARFHHDTGQVHEADAAFAIAVDTAGRAGLDDVVAQIRMSWSASLALAGEIGSAIEQLDLAEPHLAGAARGRLFTNRGLVVANAGDHASALDSYNRAHALFQTSPDELGETRLMVNRGVALVQLGRIAEARRDFERALALAERSQQQMLVANAAHNLGYVDFLLGRLPQALRAFAIARQRYEAMGSPGRVTAALDADECTVLLAAGLPEEARPLAQRVVDGAHADGNELQLADGLLLLARAHLAIGDSSAALVAALEAEARFNRTGRAPWATLAQFVAAVASAAGDPHVALGRLTSAAATLDRLGWSADAAEVRVSIGRIALRVADLPTARVALAAARARANRTSSGRVRAAAWHATALLHVLDGHPTQAKRAIAAGLRVVDAHRASLGASDLRVRASADGVEMAELGVRLALRAPRASDVLRAAERWRAGAFAGRVVAVDGDREVAEHLAELRRLERQFRKVDGDIESDIEATRAEFVRLEREITRTTRLAAGDQRAVAGALDVRRLRATLGNTMLIEYIDVDDRLYAVVANRSRTRLVELTGRADVLALGDHVGFALRRVAGMTAENGRATSVIHAFRHTADELDALLLKPLRLADGPVVVVPTGLLHTVAWSALATLHRPEGVTVAPSAGWWMAGGEPATASSGDGLRALLAHGPDLPHASTELAAIREIAPGARVLVGDEATAAAVLDAMAEADLVHIAAHGRFRADNPMFSSLQLADGSIYVHDLQRLRRVPHTVILTACSAGRSGVYRGDELLGTSAALLALGVRSVIAPTMPVRDQSTSTFAVDLHRRLAAGCTPSEALSQATLAAMAGHDPGLIATAAAFQCVGRRVHA